MGMEVYDSQYLLILAPSLVIALMFLFFWLFMKETSYDEVLARQKRDLKVAPAKVDLRKKNDKKKSKKKEVGSIGGGSGGGGGGGESEEEPREFDIADAVTSPTPEEEPVLHVPPAPVHVEPPLSLRERKKKEKKHHQQQQVDARPAGSPASEELTPVREVNGSKPTSRKIEPIALPVTQQPSPPPAEHTGKKKGSQKKQKNELHLETKVDQTPPLIKKETLPTIDVKALESMSAVPTTVTTTSGKKKNSAKKQKTEPVPVEEPLIQSAVYIPLMDSDLVVPPNPQKGHAEDVPVKVNSKKQKNETDKENSEVKLREFLAGLRSLALSEEEAVSVAAVLREKSPSALDAWHRSKLDPSAQQLQERERILTTLQEEASIAKEKVKQLSQELQAEKQKTVRAEVLLREQRSAMEEQHNVMQAKAQANYQELQGMQMKFQQLREQMEGQISRLQQENNILRDAVSSATNQMETKQSSELNQLRSEYAALVKELSDSGSKLQQEELQRKTLEVSYKQNITQQEGKLQEANRRWEDMQSYLLKVKADLEMLHANKQELQSQLVGMEAEINGKNKEIQVLHSRLTDQMLSKEQLEQRVLQLLEASQHSQPDDSLQMQVQDLINENKNLQIQVENLQAQVASQNTTVSHLEELQKLLAEKEMQRKSLEDSLNAERSSGASRENDMQVMHTENMSLKAELQKLHAQVSEQASSQLMLDQFQKSAQEKDEKIKTVEGLLEVGLIQVATREEELKVLRQENESLKLTVGALQQQRKDELPSESTLKELQRVGLTGVGSADWFGAAEDSSECESVPCKDSFPSTDDEDLELLYKFRTGEVQSYAFKPSDSSTGDLDGQKFQSDTEQNTADGVEDKDESIKLLEERLQAELENVLSKEKAIENLQHQVESLKGNMDQMKLVEAEEMSVFRAQLHEYQSLLTIKEKEVQTLQKAVEERTKEIAEKVEQVQVLQQERLTLKGQLEQQQVEMAGPDQELLTALAEKDRTMLGLQSQMDELRESLERQQKKNNDLREKNWSAMEALAATESILQGKLSKTAKDSQKAVEAAEVECQEVLHRLFPNVPLPTNQNHREWLQRFESAANETTAATPNAEEAKHLQVLEEKLRESEEAQKILQKDCETYKKVLAETEGILQRLQSSVEQEESRWRVKLEVSQEELRELTLNSATLESEVNRLSLENTELENLRHDKHLLEAELERAERESATYVTEVRELKDLLTELQSKLDGSYTEAVRQNEELNLLKTQLTETLFKLEMEENERQKVAGDLYKAQQSLDLIQAEILKEAGQVDLIENSNIASQREEVDRKEKMTAGLNQTVRELQQLLQAVNRQLTKGKEGNEEKHLPEL